MSFNAFKEFMVGFLFKNHETSKLYSYNLQSILHLYAILDIYL